MTEQFLGDVLTESSIDRMTNIVMDSFRTRPMPLSGITERESSRRVQLAEEIFSTMYNEVKWSQERILDHLPAFLARVLDGQDPIPSWAKEELGDSGSSMWGKEAAGRVSAERRLSALATVGGSPRGEKPLIIVPGGHHDNRN